jgi:hypothetical protein
MDAASVNVKYVDLTDAGTAAGPMKRLGGFLMRHRGARLLAEDLNLL